MPRRSERKPANRAVLILMLCAALGFGAFAAYVKSTPGALHVLVDRRRDADEPLAAPERSAPIRHHTEAPAKLAVSVKALVVQGSDVTLGESEEVPQGVTPEQFMADEALKAAHVDAKLTHVSVQNGTATVDFTSDIENGMGSEQEGAFLNALAVGLGQFPSIDKFQVTVGDKPVDSLGHIDISDPQDVQRSPAQSPAASTLGSQSTPIGTN